MLESLIILAAFCVGVVGTMKLDELRMRRRSERRLAERERKYRRQFFRNYEEARK